MKRLIGWPNLNLSPAREVRLEREPHTYFIDGIRYEGDSITESLKFLSKDYNGNPFYTERGRAVHLGIEYYNQGILDESSIVEEVAPYLAAYKAFQKEKDFKPLYSELSLYSEIHDYVGTLDVVGLLDGRMVVIDYKTASSVDPVVELQLGGQSLLWDEYHRTETIQGRYYLQLKSDGTFKLKDCTHVNPKLFLSAFHLWRDWKSKHVRKKK